MKKEIKKKDPKTKVATVKDMRSNSEEKALGVEVWKIKAILPLLGVIMLVLVSISVAFIPKFSQIKELRAGTEKVKEDTQDVNQRRAYIQSVDDGDLKAKQEMLLMALPESKDIYYLLNVVSGLVSDYGFMVDSFSLSPGELKEEGGDVVSDAKKTEGVSSLTFTISLIGPEDRYIELVSGLENSLPLLSLNSLESKSVSSNIVTLDLSLVTYFASKKAEVDVEKLTYKDLLMTEDEVAVLERLDGFRKIEGLFLDLEALGSGKQYQEFDVRNPFSAN